MPRRLDLSLRRDLVAGSPTFGDRSPRARRSRLPGLALSAIALSAIAVAACGPDAEPSTADAGASDAAPLPYDASVTPETLSQSGLYSDTAAGLLAPGVRPFEPRFELWTDGVDKRRWVYLPEGETIDNAHGDYWIYPEGTRLWKEFARDGMRLETRLLVKTGPEERDWYMMAYVWNEDETDAVAAPLGEPSARGTGHPVPSQAECMDCHEQMTDRALGFSAIQLDHPTDAPGVTLQTLLAEGRLRYGTGSAAPPHYPLPGDEPDQQVLGYLHANCGSCHNSRSEVLAGVANRPRLLLSIDERERASVEATPLYDSTVGVRATQPHAGRYLVQPGEPDDSAVYRRMTSREPTSAMPPLGTALVDGDAAAQVRAWIEALP